LLGAEETVSRTVDTEDYGNVIFRMGARTRGSMVASQAAAGRKNRLFMEVNGTLASLAWEQERPNELWIGHREAGNRILLKDPALLHPAARAYADLPGGHTEGYDDTFKQLLRRFYASVADPAAALEYPQFGDGQRQLAIVGAELESCQTRSWVNLPTL
jgi:predicted dehydrogenase